MPRSVESFVHLPLTQLPTPRIVVTTPAVINPIRIEYSKRDAPRSSFHRRTAVFLIRKNIGILPTHTTSRTTQAWCRSTPSLANRTSFIRALALFLPQLIHRLIEVNELLHALSTRARFIARLTPPEIAVFSVTAPTVACPEARPANGGPRRG
jgi:hypothetical protein